MKVVEYLKIGKELLKVMSSYDLKCKDYEYITLYDDYTDMRNNGLKVDYILAVLSEKYHISDSTIKRIIRRLSKEVKS